MDERVYEFYEFIANKVVDLKHYVEHMKNPEDRESMSGDILKIKDALDEINHAYDAIDEIEMSDDED